MNEKSIGAGAGRGDNARPILSYVVAISRNGIIGVDNHLPWYLPADLRYFKRITMGKPIIMGRRTHDSIGQPLPGRLNIVLSRNKSFVAPGCTVVHTAQEALVAARDGLTGVSEEIMVIGGAMIFELFRERVDRLYVTCVDMTAEGDTSFPDMDWSQWREIEREQHAADERNAYDYQFITYERRSG